MATGWIYLEFLQSKGVFLNGKARVLDVGTQHLFDVPLKQGMEFAKLNGYSGDDASLQGMIQHFVNISKWPNWDLYLCDFLALSSLDYTAYDIFNGPSTRIFDLNFESIPREHSGAFDVVMNFGTTEHVFNQYNAFKVIHEATKVGGYIFHQVPTAGYMNHGYWVYSPRTFLELAEANGYHVETAWLTGPQGTTPYTDQAQGLTWSPSLPENNRAQWEANPMPNGLINVLMRKTRGGNFRLALDTSTTATETDARLAETYSSSSRTSAPARGGLLSRLRRLWS